MWEEDFCPYCDELVKFEFIDDYYMTAEGKEADVCTCPNCGRVVSMSWSLNHNYHFNKKVKPNK